MQSILEFLILEHRIEHDLEHKEQFSSPKIYNANGDLGRRWYIYYSFRDLTSGKLKRRFPAPAFPTIPEYRVVLSFIFATIFSKTTMFRL